jgi:C-terminal processing protease CtpA/Prc
MMLLRLLAGAALVLPCLAQNTPDLARILSFETDHPNGFPGGWNGGPSGTISVDDKVVHGGKWSVRLERHEGASGSFSVITKGLPVDFAGKTLAIRGFLRTDGVTGYAGLWLREDGDTGQLMLDNMERQQLRGTTDWSEYTTTLPLLRDARQLVFGVLMAGTGTAWADDLQLLVDGKPIWEARKLERPKTALDLDHEFDKGSGIAVNELTSAQIANLATLGKVWGFLKYHHPEVVSGKRHWDYELFRVLPKILAAADRPAANKVLLDWITALGPVAPCQPCAKLDDKDLELRPDIAWLSDQKLLGAALSKSLLAIYANRPPDKQFYVSLVPGVGNPSFDHEAAYGAIKMPDAGFRLLAVYRFWNIVEYWSPNRDIVGENWDDVLIAFIPRVALAKDSGAYTREMLALVAMDHDTHANLWSSLGQRPPEGACQLPITVRFVENRAVVTGYSAESGKATGLEIGDVISQLDGVPVSKLVETWAPYYAASNEPTRLRDIARSMTRGACGDARVGVLRGSQESELRTPRVPSTGLTPNAGATHDRPGDPFQILPGQVAYLKLSSVKVAGVAHYVDSAQGTKGLIIDIRNYPSEFVVFALGQLLVDKETPFVRFTMCDLSNPGAFHLSEGPPLGPAAPHYGGKIVVLVDEITQSSAEYHAMAFRSAPRTTVIGSTTAGADGNVSQFSLPGGLSTMISGLGIFYPDKKPTQRVGIVPDVEVKPTIAGIRAGRDELVEEAMRRILGAGK